MSENPASPHPSDEESTPNPRDGSDEKKRPSRGQSGGIDDTLPIKPEPKYVGDGPPARQ